MDSSIGRFRPPDSWMLSTTPNHLTATTKGPSAQVHRIAGEDPLSGAAMKVELVSFERNAKPQVAGSHCGFRNHARFRKTWWAVLDLNQ